MPTSMIPLVLALLGAPAAAAPAPEDGPYAVVEGPEGVVRAPLFSEKYQGLAVARIDDQVVTLRDLAGLLAVTHKSHEKSAAPQAQKDFTPALDRLIAARLIGLEAHDMGFEEQPLFKREMDEFASSHLVQMLKDRATANVRPDPKDVDRIYKDSVREWKVDSVLFPKEADAKEFAAAVKGGKPFAKLSARAIADKKGEGTTRADWVSQKSAVASVVNSLNALNKVGRITPPLRLQGGWAVIRIVAMRYPENPQARAAALGEARTWATKRAVKKYYAGLVDKYVTVDQELAARLDFEAKEPGFAALEKDERILARIEGSKPITVAELAANLRTIFFHGVDRAIEDKKINAKKFPALDSLISRRLLPAEAARQHLADTEEHKAAVEDHRRNLLFSYYLDKAIAPDVKVTDADARQYYEANKKEFTFAAFYTLASIGFRTTAAAQAAFDKLKAGADFNWMKANAPDQLAPGEDTLALDGTVSDAAIPKELANALAGAKAGDLRLYGAGKQQHVIVVKQVTPPKPQDFEAVRSDILARVQMEKMNKAIQDVAAKIRKARTVKVYITRIAI
jgi:parvulin-like peptidyl-prolyl cis-trans isomerase-like protein